MNGLPMNPLRVAFDVGPLAGPRTGVGHAVAAMRDALVDLDDLELIEYIVSFRSRPPDGALRLPIPAMVAHRLWAIADRPRADRFLDAADVVHGTNYVVPPCRAAQVVSVYDCWFLRHPMLAGRAVHQAGRVLQRAIARGATVHASSTSTATEITDLFPDARVVMIPLAALPIPEPTVDPPIPALVGRPYIAAIGTLERRKNLPTLVEAFGLLAAEHDEILLVLAGADGDDRPAVNAAIDKLDPSTARRVVMTGRVDEPARSWLVRNAGVLAYPSLDEGFGFPLLDAMQVGVPVAASNRGSIPEVCGNAGLLCEADDPVALAGNLVDAVFDSGTRTRLVAAGSARVATFSWPRCAADLAALVPAPGRRDQSMIAVLCGGVGAARFLAALARVSEPADTVAIVNTGDDTVLHGLAISPDIDTVIYTLASAIDPVRGWGLADESWRAMDALQRYAAVRPDRSSAAPTWFNLGDRDLATHFYRTARLDEGATLAEVTGETCSAWGIAQKIVPMSNDRVSTVVTLVDGGDVSFQEYFVKLRHGVPITAVRFEGAEQAVLAPGLTEVLSAAESVVIAPSNPVVSIGPIRALGGVEAMLARPARVGRGHLADRRRRGAEGPRRPDAERARTRAVGGRRGPAVHLDRRFAGDRSDRCPSCRGGRGTGHAPGDHAVGDEQS